MRRRTLLLYLCGIAIAGPRMAGAQSAPLSTIGFLCLGSAAQWVPLVTAFRAGLKEAGYTEGTNVRIDFRWAEDDEQRLPALVADLVLRKADVIVATGGPLPVLAAKAATATIPIVFTLGADPVRLGIVANLGRPGGNVTGVTFIAGQLHAKRFELLHELVARPGMIAVLVNPENPAAAIAARQVQDAARNLKRPLQVVPASSEREIDAAFAAINRSQATAVFVVSDGLFYNRRQQVVALAARYALPSSFELREFVIAGGLMSYGASLEEVYRNAGTYAGRIVGGAKPADLPVLQPTKVDFALNLSTARDLKLVVPRSLQLRADEVIQ